MRAGVPDLAAGTVGGVVAGAVGRAGHRLRAGWTGSRRGKAVDTVTLPALRSLLRFLHAAGHVRWPLAGWSRLGGAGLRPWACRGRRPAITCGQCWPAAIGTARPAAATTRS